MKTATIYRQIKQRADFKIPASHCREIGRIIVRWAYYEQYIQRLIWAVVLYDNPNRLKLARVAIREPKPEEQLDLLEWVAEISGVVLDAALLKSMKKRSKEIIQERNLLAHGVWTHVPEAGWTIQQTRGAWEETAGSPGGSRKITPQALLRDQSELADVVRELEVLIADAKKLKGSIGE